MKKTLTILIAFMIFSSHDMFLKLDAYQLEPNTSATIQLFNGTFEMSENSIDRNRMIDVSLVGNGQRLAPDSSQWRVVDQTTLLDFQTGESGTWVAGVSTRARNIELAATDFNDYLEHDGVMDMLEWRKANNAMDQDAVEKYSKHVKTIFQVGDDLSDDWQTELGYPIEFVPLSNPYDMHSGHDLEVKLLWQGKPLANQLVYIGTGGNDEGHSHDHDDEGHSHDDDDNEESHHHHAVDQGRTDANGVVTMTIDKGGVWFLRTIYMMQSDEEGLTHESNWATLTFQIGQGDHDHDHGHSHGDGDHDHDDHSHGPPTYVYWIGSFALLAGLFFWFNRKK